MSGRSRGSRREISGSSLRHERGDVGRELGLHGRDGVRLGGRAQGLLRVRARVRVRVRVRAISSSLARNCKR